MTSERTLYVGLARHEAAPATPVGVMKLVTQNAMASGQFAYGRRYLQQADAQALNPDHLPLQAAALELPPARLRDGGALPLTVRDALPDSWGRKVLELRHGPLSDVDVLLLTNEDRVGAMVFAEQPTMAPAALAQPLPGLEALAQASRDIDAGREVSPGMHLLLRGGSLGGARPKATFIHAGQRYIAKFASRGDAHDMEVLEAATLTMARLCGIDAAKSLLQPLSQGHALLLQRFDREGEAGSARRLHYLSAAALLNAPYESSRGSYVELAQLIRRISAHAEHDLADLFRRLVFNLTVGNSDDHVKNHGMLQRQDGAWALAPAFDLVPQLDTHTDYQELAILPGRRESRLALAREAAPHFGLTAARADAVFAVIGRTVRDHANACVRAVGGSALQAQRLAGFIDERVRRIDS